MITQKDVEGFLILELEKQKLEVTQENMHKELTDFVKLLEVIGCGEKYAKSFNAFKDVLSLWDRQFNRTTVSVNVTYVYTFKKHLSRFEDLFKTVQALNVVGNYTLLELLLCY